MFKFSKLSKLLMITLFVMTGSALAETVSPLFSLPKYANIQNIQAAQAKAFVTQSRMVGVNLDLLFGNLNGGQKPASRIALELFKGKQYIATFEKMEKMSNGGENWIGTIEGVKFSQVIFSVKNGVLAGKISMPAGIYEIKKVGEETYMIEEIDQSAFPNELAPVMAPQSSSVSSNITVNTGSGDSCTDITVLVAYSTEAKNAAGGQAQMEALINLAVTETNKSYENSGLVQRIRLVHTIETSEAANDFNTDLSALQNTNDNIFDAVDAARETYYADTVALIIEDNQYCGLGYLNSNAAYAFSVTARTCATGYFSFGHELGHNMGAHHDWYVNSGTDTAAHGFVNLTDAWRTIMAYNSLCSDNGKYCNRLQYWSNPNVTYNTDPMGIIESGPSNCVQGSLTPDPSTCKADNHTIMNGTCATVANFRISPPPVTQVPVIMYLLN